MAVVDLHPVGPSCRAGAHRRCLLDSKTCGCECHVDEPATAHVAHVPPDRDLADDFGVSNRAGKYKPVVALTWEEPTRILPPRTHELIEALIPQLKERPGEWARVATYARPNSAATASQTMRAEHPELEVTSRRTAEGGSAMYARWKVEDDEAH